MRRGTLPLWAGIIFPLLLLGCATTGPQPGAVAHPEGKEKESTFVRWLRKGLSPTLKEQGEKERGSSAHSSGARPMEGEGRGRVGQEASRAEAPLPGGRVTPSTSQVIPASKEPAPRFVVPKGPLPVFLDEKAEGKASGTGEQVASLSLPPEREATLPPVRWEEVVNAIEAAEKALDRAKRGGGERKDGRSFRSARVSLKEAKEAFIRGWLEESFLKAWLAKERARRLRVSTLPTKRSALERQALEAILNAEKALRDTLLRGPLGVEEWHPYGRAQNLLRLAMKSYRDGEFKKALASAELAEKHALSLNSRNRERR